MVGAVRFGAVQHMSDPVLNQLVPKMRNALPQWNGCASTTQAQNYTNEGEPTQSGGAGQGQTANGIVGAKRGFRVSEGSGVHSKAHLKHI